MTTRERAVFWTVGLAATVAALFVLKPILLPFVAGMAVAYFLDPVCDRLEDKGMSRTAATALVTAIFFIVMIIVVSATAPFIYGQIVSFAEKVPSYVAAIEAKAGPLLDFVASELNGQDKPGIGENAAQYAGTAVQWVAKALARVLGGLSAVADLLSLVVLTPLVAFYLLRDWDVMVAKIDSWLPRAHAQTIRDQVKLVDLTLAGFVRGQASVCFAMGLFYGIGLTIAGLDFGFIVGFFTGLISFIPYFGMLIGLALAGGIAVAQFDTIPPILWVLGIFMAGQVLEGNFLTPKLVGGRVQLHEVWIIFALLAGGLLFGFVGILLAVPIAAVVGVLVRFLLGQYLNSPLYHHGAEPPPKTGEEDQG